ncbi:hypothetical protein J4E85_011382 [Alternaria conjuncta]|uniref:uncharacterized protein n=1 Tax=Alternaria conjuncta TaxID=181017 RepID=UPI00221EF419|nr:uncharacterized protein J4E85_011382 [Alternaria conjuncta]KAI4910565.1 hypothetical protein J4E85_011382 [Alternaria conjuncta]
MGTEMSHQQNDDHTSQSSQDGSQSCEMWMFEHIVDAMTQLRSIWTEINAPPPATIERYIVLSASETLHDSECPICQGDYDEDQHVAIKLLGTHCSHVFGRDCLQFWVNSGMQKAHYCPICRQCIRGALGGLPPSQPGAEDEEERVYEVFYDEEEEELEAELEARLEAAFGQELEEEQEEEQEEENEEEHEEENEEENEEEHEDEEENEDEHEDEQEKEEEEEEEEDEEEWEWVWEEEEEEAEQVISTQQREQRDRHWANLTEVSNILQNIETIVIPPVAAGGQLILALQVVPTIQNEDRALRETLTRLWNQSRYLNELLCINFERKQEEQQREILRAERERNILRAEMMQFTANFRRM